MPVFEYKQVWTDDYEKSNWAVPVYPVIADLQFSPGLQVGDTVNRRYRNKAIFAKPLGSDGSYTVQNYGEAKETFTISKQYQAGVRIPKPSVLHTDLNVTKSWGRQLGDAIYHEIDSDTLNAARAGAGQVIDDGTLGGTAGNGITLSIANIADIPVMAMEKFIGTNVAIDPNKRFGKLDYADYGGMKCWIISPQVWTVIQKYFMAKNTPLGDQVTVNGYRGNFFDWEIFLSNNLAFTTRLALGENPQDGDTFTVKGVTWRYKTNTATNGDIKLGATAADTADNTVAALNALTTDSSTYDAWVDGTDTVTENGIAGVDKSEAVHGISATDGTTYVDILMKGTGKVTVSSSFTSASNGFAVAGVSAGKQVLHSLFMIAKNVSLAVRQDPEIYENPVSNSIARDYIMWTVYDNNVFIDQARAIIDLCIDCSATSFAAYSNVHA